MKFLWDRRNRILTGLSIVAISAHLIVRFATDATPPTAALPLEIGLLIGTPVLLIDLIAKIFRRELGADLLAGLSIVTSIVLKEYLAGTIIMLMLTGGAVLESYAVATASSVLKALAKRTPTKAHRRRGDAIEDIALDDIAEGDILSVFPHEISPVDGLVLEGHGSMDESFLTGEPFQISKTPGSYIMSGAVNGETVLVLRATRRPVDSRFAKIMSVVKTAEKNPPKLRRMGDKLGALYVPIAVLISVAAWVATGSAHRFLAVIVIATPCPMILAIPIAVIGSISLCARRGIIIKKPVALEQIQTCRTMIFDKTGTLTYGRPALTDPIYMAGFKEPDVLAMTASLERYSRHPLAQAILEYAKGKKIDVPEATEVGEKPGEGLSGVVNGRKIKIIGRKNLAQSNPNEAAQLPAPDERVLESIVLIDGALAAILHFRDEMRPDAFRFIAHLDPQHQVSRKIIVSGDRESAVRYLADKVGIQEVHGGKSPEEKLAIVKSEMTKAPTAFIGDGINDAPALLCSTVGIAVGMNSDVTAEAAGLVVLDNSLSKIDEFFHISLRMRRIALESAIGGMALSVIGMGFAAFGYLSPVQGAIAQEIIDILAIANALRAAFLPKVLSDF